MRICSLALLSSQPNSCVVGLPARLVGCDLGQDRPLPGVRCLALQLNDLSLELFYPLIQSLYLLEGLLELSGIGAFLVSGRRGSKTEVKLRLKFLLQHSLGESPLGFGFR